MPAAFGYATGGLPMPCCSELESTTPFPPGGYQLAPTGGRASTATLTWIKRHLPAAGETYRLTSSSTSRVLRARRITTSKAAIVVETWSAGN